jgi:hypothetical protein
VTPHWELAYGWFVVIGVDQAAFSLSGCSIDSMFRALEDFNRASGLDFTNSGGRVFYRDASGEIQSADRFDFGDRAKRRQVDADTVVFNNTVSTLGDLNAGKWEMPMRDSWHMDVFGKSLAT